MIVTTTQGSHTISAGEGAKMTLLDTGRVMFTASKFLVSAKTQSAQSPHQLLVSQPEAPRDRSCADMK